MPVFELEILGRTLAGELPKTVCSQHCSTALCNEAEPHRSASFAAAQARRGTTEFKNQISSNKECR